MAKLISCKDPDWRTALERALQKREPAQLSDLDYDAHGARCAKLAKTHLMSLVYVALERRAYFIPLH